MFHRHQYKKILFCVAYSCLGFSSFFLNMYIKHPFRILSGIKLEALLAEHVYVMFNIPL